MNLLYLVYENLNTKERIIEPLPVSDERDTWLSLDCCIAVEVKSPIRGINMDMEFDELNKLAKEIIAMGLNKEKINFINSLVDRGVDVFRALQLVRYNKYRIFENCYDIVDVAKKLVLEGVGGAELTRSDNERENFEHIGEVLKREGCFFNLGNGIYIGIYDEF